MTEKRFKFDSEVGFIDNQKCGGDIINNKEIVDLLNSLVDENEQLKERNHRQAKQLDNLYQLIEKKDWRTLNDILDDFKECEEKLQSEERLYYEGDLD